MTQAVRQANERAVKTANAAANHEGPSRPHFPLAGNPTWLQTQPDEPVTRPAPAQATIKLYPTLALALLKQEQVVCGRVWLLLRYLDEAGRGWVAPDAVRRVLTDTDSSLYLFGERQLRKLLAQGDGLFWQRDEGHIWLAGLARVAAAVGVEKLAGKPVALPLAVLLGPIGDVRAHLYASFHSSRTKTERTGSASSPISRATLTDLSGVSPRTQQSYEKKAEDCQAVAVRSARRERSVPRSRRGGMGRRCFRLPTFAVNRGRPVRLITPGSCPTITLGHMLHLGRGRGRHHNRQLADLRQKGDAGNGQGRRDGRGGIMVVGLRRGRGGGNAAAGQEPHPATDFSSDFFTTRRNLAGLGFGHMARMGVVVIVGDRGRG